MNKIKIYIALLIVLLGTAATAQEDSTAFVRKDRILVQTGYNLVAGFSKGTGISNLIAEDENLLGIGINAGYFFTENFALTVSLSGFVGEGPNIQNIGLGGKWYASGVIPIEFGLGSTTRGTSSQLTANFNLGYALRLADNVMLEPNAGVLFTDDAQYELGIKFALFL